MADWTLSTATCFEPRQARGFVPIMYRQESTCASTAVIHKGHVVTSDTVVSTAGTRLVRAPSSGGTGGNLLQVAITSLMGVAAEGSTSDGSTTGLGAASGGSRRIGFYAAGPSVEFKGWCKGANAVGSTMIGTQKAIILDSTLNTFFIDSSNSTAALAAVVITGIPSETDGDTNGPCYFRFLSSNLSPEIV